MSNSEAGDDENPFDIRTIRFERRQNLRRVVLDLGGLSSTAEPGADWDVSRDARATIRRPTAFVAVVARSALRTLTLHATFVNFPTIVSYDIWAEDREDSALPCVSRETKKDPNPGCISREMSFSADASFLADRGVGRHDIEWHWYCQKRTSRTNQLEGDPLPLGVTRFVLYVLLDSPSTSPWHQPPSRDPDRTLPNPKVLDLACAFARGATNLKEGAAAVTRGIFNLGSPQRLERGSRQFVYGSSEQFLCASGDVFRVSDFMEAIDSAETSEPSRVSCVDVATAVCVFANVLGGDLETRFITIKDAVLPLNQVRLIGREPSTPSDWDNHVVAWSPKYKRVFDACLQLDMDPRIQVENWGTPAGMSFGPAVERPRFPGYRHRLLRKLASKCTFRKLRAVVIDRRPSVADDGDPAWVAMKRRYLRNMPQAPSALPHPYPLFVPHDWLAPAGFSVVPGTLVQRQWAARGLWDRSDKSGRRYRVRLNAELTPSHADARERAAQRLTLCRERLNPELVGGAIVYVTVESDFVLIVAGEVVLQLTGEGPDPLDVKSVAKQAATL